MSQTGGAELVLLGATALSAFLGHGVEAIVIAIIVHAQAAALRALRD